MASHFAFHKELDSGPAALDSGPTALDLGPAAPDSAPSSSSPSLAYTAMSQGRVPSSPDVTPNYGREEGVAESSTSKRRKSRAKPVEELIAFTPSAVDEAAIVSMNQGLRFPIPPVLVQYAIRRRVALSQLSPKSVRLIVTLMVMSHECGFDLSCGLLEEITQLRRVPKQGGLWYVGVKPGIRLCGETNDKEKGKAWTSSYVFVKISHFTYPWGSPILRTDWVKEIG
ncbi:unnamed protein product [Cochlearia groenlandica]